MTDNSSEKLYFRLRLRGVNVSLSPEFNKLLPWTRTTLTLCTAAAAYATAAACTTSLLIMVPIALFGAATPRHPFDYVYNLLIRRFTGTIKLPENRAPTRFAFGMAALWFATMALAFQTGFDGVAYLMGAIIVSAGVVSGMTYFSISGMIYQLLFGDRTLIRPAVFGRIQP